MATSNQNMECHVYHTSKCPANIGPAIGAIAITIAKVDSIFAASVRPYKSRIIARDNMGPTQAPKAWKTRQASNSSIEELKAQPTEPMTNKTIPIIKGFLRPILSLTAPQNSCANAKPIKKPVNVNSASPLRSRPISGMAGK